MDQSGSQWGRTISDWDRLGRGTLGNTQRMISKLRSAKALERHSEEVEMGARKDSETRRKIHEETDKAAQAIIDKEATRRDDKTARLREERLQGTASNKATVVLRGPGKGGKKNK
jgi:hypothetical protein